MTILTFALREGVKWHDGQPFTAQDVQCTWDMITGKSSEKLRVNPRKSWYRNLDEVTADGDYHASFHLKRPQPSFIALLASGWSPVYPCHVSPRDLRSHPIGTGPFKFVEFKPNERIKVTKNSTTGRRTDLIWTGSNGRSFAIRRPRSWPSLPAISIAMGKVSCQSR
jgi:peptide/nickel transport system substrate-binding protein